MARKAPAKVKESQLPGKRAPLVAHGQYTGTSIFVPDSVPLASQVDSRVSFSIGHIDFRVCSRKNYGRDEIWVETDSQLPDSWLVQLGAEPITEENT